MHYGYLNNPPIKKKYYAAFALTDWIDGGLFYYIEFNHRLKTLKINSTIYENDIELCVHKEEKIDTDNYRIYVPKDPDLRFAGTIYLNT